MVIMRSRFDRVKSRGFQFPYFPVWFSRSGAGALLRHAGTPENTDLNSRQLRFLRLVEPVVSPVDAAVHGDRLRLR